MTQLINSIFFAGLYASLALGLTLVFGVMRLVNLAHGDIMIGAGYLAVFFGTHLGLDPLVALVLIIPTVLVIAYPVQRACSTHCSPTARSRRWWRRSGSR